jgi:hypothetical protein
MKRHTAAPPASAPMSRSSRVMVRASHRIPCT